MRVEFASSLLKQEFHAELDLPSDRLGTSESAESGIADGEGGCPGARQVKRWCIAQIEGLGAKLQAGFFSGAETLEHREIQIAGTRASEDVPAGISVGADGSAPEVGDGRRHTESSRVEVLVEARARYLQRLAQNEIGTVERSEGRWRAGHADVAGETGTQTEDSVHLPATENPPLHRNLVERTEDELVGNVRGGEAALPLGIKGVHRARGAFLIILTRAGVAALCVLRERVVCEESQAAREAA